MNKEFIDRRPTVRNLGLIVVAGFMCLAEGRGAQGEKDEEQACTQETLQGSYGYIFNGSDGPATREKSGFWSGPVAAAVGLMTFDGAGGISARDTLTASGPVSRRTGTGTYSVGVSNFPPPSEAKCMGKATLGGDFSGLSFDFMIVPGSEGREFSLVITNAGKAQIGVALKTGDEPCSNANLKGTYRVESAGLSLVNGPTAAVGFRILDGAGNLTYAEDTISGNGQIRHRVGRSATYRVLSDCTVSEVFADGPTFEGVVTAYGQEAYFVRTGPGPTGPIPVFYKRW